MTARADARRRQAGLAAGMVLTGLALIGTASAAEDGRRLFEARCASCHATRPDAPPGPGPNLARLDARPIAGDAGFDYSPALRAARGRWSRERLDAFLEDPEEMFPGLWMGGNGIRDPEARRAVVDVLMAR